MKLALVTACLVASPEAAQPPVIAVVVHPDSPLSEISFEDLGRLFRGHTTTLSDGTHVMLFEHDAVRERFYRQVLSMSLNRASRHWISVVFSGGGASPPSKSPIPPDCCVRSWTRAERWQSSRPLSSIRPSGRFV